jgi:proteasome lid subunit RPN8/RPN11
MSGDNLRSLIASQDHQLRTLREAALRVVLWGPMVPAWLSERDRQKYQGDFADLKALLVCCRANRRAP